MYGGKVLSAGALLKCVLPWRWLWRGCQWQDLWKSFLYGGCPYEATKGKFKAYYQMIKRTMYAVSVGNVKILGEMCLYMFYVLLERTYLGTGSVNRFIKLSMLSVYPSNI